MRQAIAQIFYFEWRVFGAIIAQNVRHFRWKRFLVTLVFVFVMAFISVLTLFLRLLDEIFYHQYRKVEVKQPVFIISNPRSGTTYFHRLLCLDEERFTYFLLYHTFLPSVSFYRFIRVLKRLDQKMDWPMKRFFNKVEDWLFKGWKNIHPMGFEESEEDEGLFVLTLMSPAIGLICPWFKEMKWMWISDCLSEPKKAAMMAYYHNTIQRFLYACGPEKVFLSKNVISTGRINMLLKAFPKAKIIYPVRHPYQTIPSLTSMFSAPWKVVAPEIPEQSPEYRSWGALSMSFYLHFSKIVEEVDEDRVFCVRYDEFVQHPERTVLDLYAQFNWEISPEFRSRLHSETSVSRSYRSKHDYTLEQYGYDKKEVYRELQPVFDRFGFEP